MKIYIAGGEGLNQRRQTAVFEAGCRHRLTSFFSGNSMQRVITAADAFEEANSESKSAIKNDSDGG